jgi:hypothetical protein
MAKNVKKDKKTKAKVPPKAKVLNEEEEKNVAGGVLLKPIIKKPVAKMGDGCPDYCVFGTPDQFCY